MQELAFLGCTERYSEAFLKCELFEGKQGKRVMDLQATVKIIWQKKWLIAFSILLTTLLTAGMTRLTGSQWSGTVKFLSPIVSPLAESPQEHNSGSVLDAHAQAMMYASVVKSIDVIEPALHQLSFANSAADILDRIEFEPSGDRMYQLKVVDTNPRRAEQLANAIADSFVKRNQNLVTQQANRIVTLLEEELRQADDNITKIRKRYDTYSVQHKVVGDPASQIYLVIKRLETSRLNRNAELARAAQARAHYQNRRNALDKLPDYVTHHETAVQSALSKSLESELAQIELQLLELRQRYTDSEPKIMRLMERRQQLTERLGKEQKKRVDVVLPNPERASLPDTVEELKQIVTSSEAAVASEDVNIANAEAELKKLREVSSPLTTIAAELTSATETRTNLSTRLNTARIALDSAAQQHSLVIIEHVNATNPPVNMTSGRSKRLIMLAALCALIASSALVIGFDSIDRRVKTVEQLERLLPVRVLAAIPQPTTDVPLRAMARATEKFPLSAHAEAYRFLGQSTLRMGPDMHAIMTLAAKSGQGSTSTIVNLGITMAQSGQRVLLVDTNVRNPRLHIIFEIPNEFGLTNILLSPQRSAVEQAIRTTAIPNLYVVTSGPASHNPWELFSSGNLQKLTQYLHEQADKILYDTPSAVTFTDAINLAPFVDGALLCVRALESLSGEEGRLISQIDETGTPVLGCVMTDVPAAILESFHDYQRNAMRSHVSLPAMTAAPHAVLEETTDVLSKTKAVMVEETSDVLPQENSDVIFAKTTAIIPKEDTPTYRDVLTMSSNQEDLEMGNSFIDRINDQMNAQGSEVETALPKPVFSRAFNGYAVASVDDYVERITLIVADLQRHIDQQSIKIEQQSAHLAHLATQNSGDTAQTAALHSEIEQMRAQTAFLTGQAAEREALAAQNADLLAQGQDVTERHAMLAVRNEALGTQVIEQEAALERMQAELKAARQGMTEMLDKEAAILSSLMNSEQERARLEQERAEMQLQIEQERVKARQESEAMLSNARAEAQAIVLKAKSSEADASVVEEARAMARAQAMQMITLLKDEAGALLTEARRAAINEAEARYQSLYEQLQHERNLERAEIEQERVRAREESEAMLLSARQTAHTLTEEAHQHALEAAKRMADTYAAHEGRLKTLGMECTTVISGIRHALEAQLTMASTPAQVFSIKTGTEGQTGEEAANRASLAAGAWQ